MPRRKPSPAKASRNARDRVSPPPPSPGQTSPGRAPRDGACGEHARQTSRGHGRRPDCGQKRAAEHGSGRVPADQRVRGNLGLTPAPGGAGRPAAGYWPQAAPLFPPLSASAREALELLPEALAKVWPLSAAHRRSLPEDVAALSRRLTSERNALIRPYWSSPAFVSAYLYYFLPWNLLRLTRLLTALPLPAPCAAGQAQSETQGGREALLLDVGSGPLTLPLALWLARPQWREAPLRILALDSAAQPLELGKALLATLGGLLGQKTWPVRTARGPLEHLARQAAPLLAEGRVRPWLVSAANVLNEVRFSRRDARHSGGRGQWAEVESGSAALPEDECSDNAWDIRFQRLLDGLSPLFLRAEKAGQAAPALLFVEPGTRLGGGAVMRLRALALEAGLTALAPCPHNAACPLLGATPRAAGRDRSWCHFTFDSQGAPDWLLRLSAEAGLAKSGLSLAPLLLTAAGESASPAARGTPQGSQAPGSANIMSSPARVLSAPFEVPGLAGRARYACAAGGMVLLEDAESLPSGGLLPVRLTPDAPRDAKSRARIVRRPPAPKRGQRA